MGTSMFNTVVPPNGAPWTSCRGDCCVQARHGHYQVATSNHSGGVNASMADGSVKFIKNAISPTTWSALEPRIKAKRSAPTRIERSHEEDIDGNRNGVPGFHPRPTSPHDTRGTATCFVTVPLVFVGSIVQREAAGMPAGLSRAPLIQSSRVWYSGELLASNRTPPEWAFLVGSFWASASSAASQVGLPSKRLSAGRAGSTTRSAGAEFAHRLRRPLTVLAGRTILRIVCERCSPCSSARPRPPR